MVREIMTRLEKISLFEMKMRLPGGRNVTFSHFLTCFG